MACWEVAENIIPDLSMRNKYIDRTDAVNKVFQFFLGAFFGKGFLALARPLARAA
jgi:hypothetical protein